MREYTPEVSRRKFVGACAGMIAAASATAPLAAWGKEADMSSASDSLDGAAESASGSLSEDSAAGGATYSLDLADHAQEWEKLTSEDGFEYYALDVVYCSQPADPSVEHLIIYAPSEYLKADADGNVALNEDGSITSSTGAEYTASTAPIMFTNTVSGYASSATEDATVAFLEEGYVQVSVGARGIDSYDTSNNYIGAFPAVMADLKAAVRFLKANSDLMPGNTDRIVSHGFSAGGAVSTLLGASGNSALFDDALAAIGAAEASDDICVALCYCPITNLNTVDANYEWYQRANTSYTTFGDNPQTFSMGENPDAGEFEPEMSGLLYDWFVAYVQDKGFDLGDDGRSGAYFDDFVALYSDGLTEFLARYDSIKAAGEQSFSRVPERKASTVQINNYDTADDYLEHLYADYNADAWLQWDEDSRTATISDFDAFMTNFLTRGKACPSHDCYNYTSRENSGFTNDRGEKYHFSVPVRDCLETLAPSYDMAAEQFDAYDSDLSDEASTLMSDMMSPVSYIQGEGSSWESTLAPHFRFRIGGNDPDSGLPAAWLTYQTLTANTDVDAQIAIVWDKPHMAAEYLDQDLFDYIGEVMAAD